jgi:putative membrane protein
MLLVIASILVTPRANQTAMAADKKHDVSRHDEDFVRNAASGGMLEVTLGRHAATHADRQAVRDFGQRMVADHNRINVRLKQIAKDADIDLPTHMERQHTEESEKLIAQHGAEFDAQYMKHMVLDHQEDIKQFEDEVQHGSDHAIIDFAKDNLPTLKNHLQMAEKVQSH